MFVDIMGLLRGIETKRSLKNTKKKEKVECDLHRD